MGWQTPQDAEIEMEDDVMVTRLKMSQVVNGWLLRIVF